ncbi:hypothetical protein GGF46_002020 [Coemansia sp. RSA 552]|nr:hypothetical protein GGF46_002020 [Coemansia sp. RSA 552]
MLLRTAGIVAALASSAIAHMALTSPCPRFSPNCDTKPTLPYGVADYDANHIKDPIDPANGVLCKTQTPWPQPVAEWTEGQAITVTFQKDGGAHGGGHCQFSLSFDGGKTFNVIHEELRYCFFGQPSSGNDATVLEYTFNLPKSLPSSKEAIFSWSWVNAIGNREFYMNCADVSIKGTGSSFKSKDMVIANINGYPTIPEFHGDYDTGLDLYGQGAAVVDDVVSDVASVVKGLAGADEPVPSVKSPAVPGYEAGAAEDEEEGAYEGGEAVGHGADDPAPTPTPTPQAQAVAAPVPPPALSTPPSVSYSAVPPGECTAGAMACNPDSSGFRICMWGKWSDSFACGAGSVCKSSDAGAVYCGWQ